MNNLLASKWPDQPWVSAQLGVSPDEVPAYRHTSAVYYRSGARQGHERSGSWNEPAGGFEKVFGYVNRITNEKSVIRENHMLSLRQDAVAAEMLKNVTIRELSEHVYQASCLCRS